MDDTTNDKSGNFQPFRGLPITREQDAEIRAYIARHEARGYSWDTSELDYMIQDMLYPAPTDDRLELCESYAHELASHVRNTGQKLGEHMPQIYAITKGNCSDSEWKRIVRDAARIRSNEG